MIVAIPTTHPVPPPFLLEGRFTGSTEFAELIRQALMTAAQSGWREIIMSDSSFEDWPLGERAVSESLQAWSKSGRKLTLLAKNYDAIVRRHARFVTWRRTWDHIIECRSCSSLSVDDFPSALWSPVWVLQRLDIPRSTGLAGYEAMRRVHLKERLNECLRKSTLAFPASVLGI